MSKANGALGATSRSADSSPVGRSCRGGVGIIAGVLPPDSHGLGGVEKQLESVVGPMCPIRRMLGQAPTLAPILALEGEPAGAVIAEPVVERAVRIGVAGGHGPGTPEDSAGVAELPDRARLARRLRRAR